MEKKWSRTNTDSLHGWSDKDHHRSVNKARSKVLKKKAGKKMETGHNMIKGGKIYNSLYPGGYDGSK